MHSLRSLFRTGVAVCALVGALASFPQDGAAQARKSVAAVMPFDVVNAAPAQGADAARRVHRELTTLRRFTLIEHSQAEEFVKEAVYRQEPCEGVPCAQRMGKALGVEIVIRGTLTHHEDGRWTLALEAVDVASGRFNPVEPVERQGPLEQELPVMAALAAAKVAQLGSSPVALPQSDPPREVRDAGRDPEDRGFPRSGFGLYTGTTFTSGTAKLEDGSMVSYSMGGTPNLSVDYQWRLQDRWSLGLFMHLGGGGEPSGKLSRLYTSGGPALIGFELRYWYDQWYVGGNIGSAVTCFIDSSEGGDSVESLCYGGTAFGPSVGYQFPNGWFVGGALNYADLGGNTDEEISDSRVPRVRSATETNLWFHVGYRWGQKG